MVRAGNIAFYHGSGGERSRLRGSRRLIESAEVVTPIAIQATAAAAAASVAVAVALSCRKSRGPEGRDCERDARGKLRDKGKILQVLTVFTGAIFIDQKHEKRGLINLLGTVCSRYSSILFGSYRVSPDVSLLLWTV